MMTNSRVLQVAMQQSAWDMNCNPDDFLKDEPVLVTSDIGEKAKKYYKEPIACNFISYGSNIVASVKTEYRLPDLHKLQRISCGYELRILMQPDFQKLYTDEWDNAICEDRKELDVLGVGAYDNGILIGLAGCSADAENMWQIGVDVLPSHRKQGIAASLVSNLAMETIDRGNLPFYCCAWSNIRSAKTAIKAGFCPGWVEMTVKPAEVVDEMNK